MKIIFLVPYPKEGASNRYRVWQFVPYLEAEGIVCIIRPFWHREAFKILYKKGYGLKKLLFFILGTISRVFDVIRSLGCDIVFIHREVYPIGTDFFESILAFFGKRLIFDFDDAIFLPSISKPNSFIERLKAPDKVRRIISKSSWVITGNDYLKDFALKYNNSVTTIPTCIDTLKYAPQLKRGKKSETVIGWIGSSTTLDFLNPMKNIFIAVSSQFNVSIRVVADEFAIEGVANLVSKPWSLDEELQDLRTFDIGIMPMPDNQWTRGKCAFKAILYMSMALPCVVSKVGVNRQLIEDGVNGFLAESEEEWIEKILMLIKDTDLRERMGIQARRTVEKMYSLSVNAPTFSDVLNRVYSKGLAAREKV